jgi:hypothetical protein
MMQNTDGKNLLESANLEKHEDENKALRVNLQK